MSLVELTILIPAVAALLSFIIPKGKGSAAVTMTASAATLVAAAFLSWTVFTDGAVEYGLWYADSLSAMFVMLIAVIGMASSVYSYGYISKERDEGVISAKDERVYFTLFNLFISIMLLTCLVNSVGLMWIAIEATTLVSAFLVGFYKKESSTEAAWKYLMICTAGITLALVGITLVYAASTGVLQGDNALDWTVLYAAASQIDPVLMKTAFVFILIGFGTKMGLVPMHTWLPDAHSQAPTPISAMLSAVLLNCALYGVLRFKIITDVAVPGYTQYLLIGFGILTLIVASMFILTSKDLKRMLAYSSIEHMGIIAIGFGIGTQLAVLGAVMHVIAHSVTKSFLFMSAGNIIQEYGTGRMEDIRGLREKMPFTAFMFTAGILAITGLPPFAVFIGEITIILGALGSGMYAIVAVTIVFIVIVFAGFMRNAFPMLNGTTEKEIKDTHRISKTVPIAALMIISLVLGLFMPEQLMEYLSEIAAVISGAVV